MKQATQKEYSHMFRVKQLPCGNCGAPPPTSAHHIIENGTRISHYATIPLCHDCHQDSKLGIHGEKRAWQITKKTELSILADTMRMLT